MKALTMVLGGEGFATARRFAGSLPVRLWANVAAERRRLARLDARMLADIGVDAGAAEAEAGRAFWDTARHG